MRYILSLLTAILLFSCTQNKKQEQVLTASNIDSNIAKVFFKNLNDGDSVTSPFVVEMGSSMPIKPAGVLEPGTGHHHIIIDKGFMPYGEIIPMDPTHLHYGKGDTEVVLNLPSGPHQLTLQFANGMHMSYGEQFSKTVNIYVK